MRSILFVALFTLIAVAPTKADEEVDKEGSSSSSCKSVTQFNIFLVLNVDPSKYDDALTAETILEGNLATFAELDSPECVAVYGLGSSEIVEVYVASLNPEKTIATLNTNFELVADGTLLLKEYFDDLFSSINVVEAAAIKATVDKETPETTAAFVPEVLFVFDAILVDLKTHFALQESTEYLIGLLCQSDADKCEATLIFLAASIGDLLSATAKDKEQSTTDAATPGVSVGTVVGISIGCVAGTLLIALIAVKAKTGSAIPRRGRVSLSPTSSSSSSSALLGQRIDVRSAWAEAEI